MSCAMLPVAAVGKMAYGRTRQLALRSRKAHPYNQVELDVSMNSIAPFWSVERSCDSTLRWLRRRLSRQGLRALQTFDLHDARLAAADCPCPHHGTTECGCQMIVLLVYGPGSQPATLILHGNEVQSWLSLVDTAAQQADGSLRLAIEQALHINPSKQGL